MGGHILGIYSMTCALWVQYTFTGHFRWVCQIWSTEDWKKIVVDICYSNERGASEFGITNMKAWIHHSFYQQFRPCWWCNGVGGYILTHFALFIPTEQRLNTMPIKYNNIFFWFFFTLCFDIQSLNLIGIIRFRNPSHCNLNTKPRFFTDDCGNRWMLL